MHMEEHVSGLSLYRHREPVEDELANYCDAAGAAKLKAQIEQYWIDKGSEKPQVNLYCVGFHPAIRAARYDIRSDLVNGMPRRRVAITSEAA